MTDIHYVAGAWLNAWMSTWLLCGTSLHIGHRPEAEQHFGFAIFADIRPCLARPGNDGRIGVDQRACLDPGALLALVLARLEGGPHATFSIIFEGHYDDELGGCGG